MIISNEEAAKRLNSPGNLINKLRSATPKNSAMGLFGVKTNQTNQTKQEDNKTELVRPRIFNPFEQKNETNIAVIEKNESPVTTPNSPSEQNPSISNLLSDSETQIKLGLAHDNALSLLNKSVDILTTKLDDIKADKLPSVISAASKVVEGIRKERNEASRNSKGQDVHYHFYTPVARKVEEYTIIEVEGHQSASQ